MFGKLFGWFESGEEDHAGHAGSTQPSSAESSAGALPQLPSPAVSGVQLESLMGFVADQYDAHPDQDLYDDMVPFYKALTSAVLLAPTMSVGEESGTYRLMISRNEEEEPCVVVFTTEAAMALWVTERTSYVGIPFRLLCARALAQGLQSIVINPMGPARAELTPYEMSYLAEGLVPPHVNRKNGLELTQHTQVQVGMPPEPPSPMLMERLSGCFGQDDTLVEKAYVFQISIDDGPPHLAMGIRLMPGCEGRWERDLLPNTMAISREVLDRNEYVDFFLLNEAEALEDSLTELTEPFYSNEKLAG